MRIIPSLSGSLYKFDGSNIDAIPITAETLLRSSFRYSDDLVIAGGLEIRTYGVVLDSGKCLYVCSSLDCKNFTDDVDGTNYVAVVERSTRTVRAIEPRTGTERWNFSVGVHNIKIPQIDCINSYIKYEFDITAVLPDGKLNAKITSDFQEYLWNYQFTSPIVNIWKFDGRDLDVVDIFKAASDDFDSASAIYLGMHNKQLYIHESDTFQTALEMIPHSNHTDVVDSMHFKIPWNPIPAGDTALVPIEPGLTALSVLNASEYVNGNGYYLYTEKVDGEPLCDSTSNTTKMIGSQEEHEEDFVIMSIWFWW